MYLKTYKAAYKGIVVLNHLTLVIRCVLYRTMVLDYTVFRTISYSIATKAQAIGS